MITRILPRDEYVRLIGTELEAVRDQLPETALVPVVEDGDGELVGCLGLIPVWHSECLWVAERERGHGRVLRRLRTALGDAMTERGVSHVFVGATKPQLADIVTRLGGLPIPGEQFLLPVLRK